MGLLQAWLLVGFTAACIPIPVGQKDPFEQEEIASLNEGGADRASVVQKPGKPARMNAAQDLYLYHDFQLQAVLLVGGGYTGRVGEVMFIGPHLMKSENRSGTLRARNQIYTFRRLAREDALGLIAKMRLLNFTG